MTVELDIASLCSTQSTSLPILPARPDGDLIRTVISGGRRLDGRLWEDVRRMHMRVEPDPNASSCAFFCVGNTKVQCTVIGPRAATRNDLQERGHLRVDYKTQVFSAHAEKTSTDAASNAAAVLHQALDAVVQLNRYPKSVIEVCILVLEDDGGALAAALTCAGLALADAGIECHDVIAGASAYAFTYYDEQQRRKTAIMLDLDQSEYSCLSSMEDFTEVHLGFCPALASICCLQCTGPLISGPCGDQLFGLCEAVSAEIGREVRRCLRQPFLAKSFQSEEQCPSVKEPSSMQDDGTY